MKHFKLSRNAVGQLVFSENANSEPVAGVVPVRSFPMSAPDAGLALVAPDGTELVWVDSLTELQPPVRALIEEELAQREFLPEIVRLRAVSSFATPSTWTVDTDRGSTEFVLKAEEDIRQFGGTSLLISDSHGIRFLIRDQARMDRVSRKLLDRFL